MQKNFKIYSHTTQILLYEGHFPSLKTCLEHAVTEGVDLSCADLRSQDLSTANLDGAHLSGADFSGSNLSGANLSESILSKSRLTETTLHNTCLAYSDLSNSNLEQASFGATDITGCDLSFCTFAGLSCFSLNFMGAKTTLGCVYRDADKVPVSISNTPVVIKGLGQAPIIFTDNQIYIGHKKIDWPSLIDMFSIPRPRIEGAR